MTLTTLIDMFGTETAGQNFINLCKEYFGERVRQESGVSAGMPVPNSRRAEVHAEIMRIVQKLYLQRKEPMPARKEVGLMIMEYFRHQTTANR